MCVWITTYIQFIYEYHMHSICFSRDLDVVFTHFEYEIVIFGRRAVSLVMVETGVVAFFTDLSLLSVTED